MWNKFSGICEIKAITNAQNWHYWADKQLYNYIDEHKLDAFIDRKVVPEKNVPWILWPIKPVNCLSPRC